MNKELTPMMELIEKIWKLNKLTDYQKTLVEKEIIELLPKEKQVIEDAFDNIDIDPDNWDGETYYNTKYNNQIK